MTVTDWQQIHTVFLDMDGTLLDLHFDNHFWLEHLPQRFAEMHDLAVEQAKQELFSRYRDVEGTLAWYCLDHWSRELGMDIPALKHEIAHLIQVRSHVPEFLDALRAAGKRVVLLTNAHGASVTLKLDYTGIEGHFDRVISSHGLGLAHAEDGFWDRLHAMEPYAPEHTLMVDDNLSVLGAARRHGVAFLLAIRRPDSKREPKDTGDFRAIDTFDEVLPALTEAMRLD